MTLGEPSGINPSKNKTNSWRKLPNLHQLLAIYLKLSPRTWKQIPLTISSNFNFQSLEIFSLWNDWCIACVWVASSWDSIVWTESYTGLIPTHRDHWNQRIWLTSNLSMWFLSTTLSLKNLTGPKCPPKTKKIVGKGKGSQKSVFQGLLPRPYFFRGILAP